MLVYLSKKINIPNHVVLNCISWNRDQGWIACGGESGLLKVLKLETPSGPDARLQGIAASSNLSMNQTLEGHTGAVMCVTWNPIFRKLTTSDESGLIIVWMLHKGMWYEEMINNRNKSVVRDMQWTSDGRKIAIVYEDGAVIVGSVDGNRLWGKELNMPLRFVEWSPDARWILFVTLDAEVWIFDADGNKIRSLTLIGQDHSALGGEVGITGIHWFCSGNSSGNYYRSSSAVVDKSRQEFVATFCIAFENGTMQLSNGEDEHSTELVDTELATITHVKWSSKGTILAVVGSQASGGRDRAESKKETQSQGSNIVKFYDNKGIFIRSIRIPGEHISAVSWEGGDLRLALAVDSFIYFANIRHSYPWAYFLNTVVFAYPRPDRREIAVVFWDLVSHEAHTKYLKGLKFLAASGDLCAVVECEKTMVLAKSVASDEAPAKNTGKEKSSKKGDISDSDDDDEPKNRKTKNQKTDTIAANTFEEVYTIQLRNSIGAVVDSKVLPFAPKLISMGAYNVVAANDRTIWVWQFHSKSAAVTGISPGSGVMTGNTNDVDFDLDDNKGSGTGGRLSQSKVRMFDIGHTTFTTAQSPETFQIITETMADPITATCISDKFLAVGRKSGAVTRFNLPHLTAENTYTVKDREPAKLDFNCMSSKLAFVDSHGVFSILDLEAKVQESDETKENSKTLLGPYYGKKLSIERKDVWDLRWSEDDPDMIVVMEKTKMVVINQETPEEPVVSSAYLARFKDLEIRVVAMDTLMMHPDKIAREYVFDYESKALREARDLIAAEGLPAGYTFAERNSHPRLWKLLAVSALEDMELGIAEKAYVRCGDYHGVQLVKQLLLMPDKMKARAEAAVSLGKFDEAENIYREIDRKDLAIQLRKRLGDYMRVVQLLQTGGGNDNLTREAWDQIGEYYADRLKWKKAAQYFQMSKNYEKLVECYYRLENFEELAKLRLDLPDDAPLLVTLAKRFESVGMYEEAVDCYVRSPRPPKEAVDCCVLLNKWELALQLAERYDYPQVEGLLIKFAMHLVSSDRKLEAVELFRVANKPTEAAILVGDIAEMVATKQVNPALAKKLHVLSALEVERHRKRTMDMATQAATAVEGAGGTIAQATAATLETLMMTALDTQVGQTTLGGTLAATLGATLGGTLGAGANAKKMSKAFGSAWRGAAAYHFYMLALNQFYAGSLDAAMKTSIKLCEYDDVLNPKHIYCLLCLCALKNKFYGTCSKAFVKLETLPEGVSAFERDAIQTLAVKVFISNAPVDPASLPEPYLKCLEVGRTYKACVISGRAIQDSPSHMCKTCRHQMLEHEIETKKQKGSPLQNCPLCHSPLIHSSTGNTTNPRTTRFDLPDSIDLH